MNTPRPPSPLAAVPLAPKDPILGVTETFNADPNPRKVNLGVGVYTDESGKVPLLECVRRAEAAHLAKGAPHGYLPIDGLPAYDRAVRDLLFGADSAAVQEGRALTVQALGGTGGLKVGADFLRRTMPQAEVWISEPSWENHRALFEGAGFKVNAYPYYDAASHGVDFGAMRAALDALPAGAIVVLHVCCHNPTGADLAPAQWQQVLDTVRARALIPFLDIAYQGFGDGIEADGAPLRLFAAGYAPLFVSSSYSKSFSLYGERIGALSVVTSGSDESARVLSQLKRIIRANYSNPPTLGSQIVATVLTTPELRALWEQEVGGMRERIKAMRRALVGGIERHAPGVDMSFVLRQRGMFSYSGLTRAQVARLRSEFSIYAVESGRICVAALNSRNVDYVAEAVAQVMRHA